MDGDQDNKSTPIARTLCDSDIVTNSRVTRRSFFAKAGFGALGAGTTALGILTVVRGAQASDSDKRTFADTHVCDSDTKDARCDHDLGTFADPKQGDAKSDSDKRTFADSHISDSDGNDAPADHDQGTFADAKHSSDSD